jgi:hypothetical protein
VARQFLHCQRSRLRVVSPSSVAGLPLESDLFRGNRQ